MNNIVCQGHQCPIKKQCKNYSTGEKAKASVAGGVRQITKCTNQKLFTKKDEEK